MEAISEVGIEMAPRPVVSGRNWFAVYTAPNHEKRVEQHFRMRNIESFLPLYKVKKRWKNRTTATLEVPLFAGYVFVRIATTERVRVLEVPSVLSLVGSSREATPLPEDQIESLRTGLHLREVEPYPYLKAGNRVRIRSGALAGLEGIVVRKDNQLRVVLSIDLISRSVAVQVDASEVEACSQSAS
jgi:transcription antitermination factor NusG